MFVAKLFDRLSLPCPVPPLHGETRHRLFFPAGGPCREEQNENLQYIWNLKTKSLVDDEGLNGSHTVVTL